MEYDFLRSEEKLKIEKPFYKNGWFIVIIILIGLGMLSTLDDYNSSNKTVTNTAQSAPSVQPVVESQPVPVQRKSESTFDEISLVDQNRMREIVTGVMQNTIIITPEIKTEFKNILKKYNTTDAEINDFISYGPYFAADYQALFFTDALQAVASGLPVKSSDRLNKETEALARGLLTAERIKTNDQTMILIANHQPVTGSDGRQVYFTEETIKSGLKNILDITGRLIKLYE